MLLFLLGGGARAETVILVYGDSLSAAYGIAREAGWANLLARRLAERHPGHRVVNASVSGETTAGGLTRLPEVLAAHRPAITILALGANDGLRGLPPAQMKKNLEEIVTRAKSRGITVILTGMEAPPNYGPLYTAEFRNVFKDLADDHDVAFVPFFLEGVAGNPTLNQRDGIHPNAEGARIVEQLVWQTLEPVLEK